MENIKYANMHIKALDLTDKMSNLGTLLFTVYFSVPMENLKTATL